MLPAGTGESPRVRCPASACPDFPPPAAPTSRSHWSYVSFQPQIFGTSKWRLMVWPQSQSMHPGHLRGRGLLGLWEEGLGAGLLGLGEEEGLREDGQNRAGVQHLRPQTAMDQSHWTLTSALLPPRFSS